MFSSLASVSKSKPSTSKSSLIVQSFDTFAARFPEGYALIHIRDFFVFSFDKLQTISYTLRMRVSLRFPLTR